MKYTVAADTDIGPRKETNQDSILVKHGQFQGEELVMAVICDGMGGLDRGELASATVIRAFDKWFNEELPRELHQMDMLVIGGKWEKLIKELNEQIGKYGAMFGVELGTTFSGILIAQEQYVLVHVGDSRIYHIDRELTQLTRDQTFVEREVERGTMTVEAAKRDRRRNLLLQCIGASKDVKPEIKFGFAEQGVYLLCSDGFRHEVSNLELTERLAPGRQGNRREMEENIRFVIDLVKSRGERDNISAVLVKAE